MKHKLIYTRRLNRFPGDTAIEITKAAVTDTGVTVPEGTVVQPESSGAAGAGHYQTVRAIKGNLAGQSLTFISRNK